jgi:hypothetical protein
MGRDLSKCILEVAQHSGQVRAFEGIMCSLPMKIRILTRLGFSNLLGNERHCVAESFKLPDRTLCQPRAISLLEIG